MNNELSPFCDNFLYEQVYERHAEDAIIQEYIDHPRRAVQITGGEKHNEAIRFARRLKAALVKAGLPTIVFYRFSTDDSVHGHWAHGRWEEKMTPSFAAAWLKDTAQGGLVPSYNNEPTAGTLKEVAAHAKETLIYLNELRAPPIVALNWHSGFIPNLENHYGGEFDEVYRMMEARGDYAGFHGYMNTRFLDDPAKPIHIGRHRHIVPKHKFPRLKIVYTEFGFDSHLPNPQLDGYQNHEALWATLFPGKDPIDVYWDEAVKADTAILAEDDVIVLWFCRGHNGTSRWVAFNYWDESVLIERMRNYRRKEVATNIPAPTTGGVKAVITKLPGNTTRREVRTQPNASAQDVGDLHLGDTITLFKDSPQNGNWLYHTSDSAAGWSEFTGVQYDERDLEPAPEGVVLTLQERDAINGHVADMRAAADAIAGILKGAKPVSDAGGF